jgi:DnaJ-class molecular chaperone
MILYDDNSGENNSPFLNVQEAYSVLSDPVQRSVYDATLENKSKRQHHFRQPELMGRQYKDEVEPLIPEKGPFDLGVICLQSLYQFL